MELKQMELTSKEWVLTIGGRNIPLSAIKTGIMTVILFAIVALAYNIGMNDAYQIVAISAYYSGEIYDPITNSYKVCFPEQEGVRVSWVCTNKTIEYRE